MGSIYYYRNTTDNKGKHEVHKAECSYIPGENNRTRIGYAENCHAAIQAAQRATGKYNFDGCYYCSTACHTG